jgi:hypothetical protein
MPDDGGLVLHRYGQVCRLIADPRHRLRTTAPSRRRPLHIRPRAGMPPGLGDRNRPVRIGSAFPHAFQRDHGGVPAPGHPDATAKEPVLSTRLVVPAVGQIAWSQRHRPSTAICNLGGVPIRPSRGLARQGQPESPARAAWHDTRFTIGSDGPDPVLSLAAHSRQHHRSRSPAPVGSMSGPPTSWREP